MRIILSLIIWVAIVGGLWGYTQSRMLLKGHPVQNVQPEMERTTRSFSLGITPTFSVEEDPFSLALDQNNQQGFQVAVNGKLIPISPDELKQGQRLTITDVGNIARGLNEIYVQASPPLQAAEIEYGVRILLLEEETIVAEKTFWSQSGSLVTGTLVFNLEEKEQDHDH